MDERIRRILENSATFRTMKGHSESSNSMFVESSYPTFGSSNKFNHIKEFNDKLRTFDSRLPKGRKIRMTDTYGFYTPAELIDYADKKLGNLHMLQDENPIAETSLYQTEHYLSVYAVPNTEHCIKSIPKNSPTGQERTLYNLTEIQYTSVILT